MTAMPSATNKTMGIELELLAPRSKTRRDLADALAIRFHGATEPSATVAYDGVTSDGQDRYSLRPSFGVVDQNGRRVAHIVDDITIKADLDRAAPSNPAWGRVVSTDCELLRSLSSTAHLAEPSTEWLAPLVDSHGAVVRMVNKDTAKAVDPAGKVLALATGLPGERERPAEVVSPPLRRGHRTWLDAVLDIAADLGFALPTEAAVHLHFDAQPFMNAPAFASLVQGFVAERDTLRELVGTNRSSQALGPWPDALLDLVRAPEFASLEWSDALERIQTASLIKHCDLNLLGLIGQGAQPTIEFRFFPGSMDAIEIMLWADVASDCLDRWTPTLDRGSHPLTSALISVDDESVVKQPQLS